MTGRIRCNVLQATQFQRSPIKGRHVLSELATFDSNFRRIMRPTKEFGSARFIEKLASYSNTVQLAQLKSGSPAMMNLP